MIRPPNLYAKLFVVTLCFSLLLGLGSAGWCVEPPQYLGLTILHTNDIHGHIFPLSSYDAHYDSNDIVSLKNVGGAARQAALIRRTKNESTYPVLVMSAGDVFARGPIADLKGEPDFEIMNLIPYDILTLGNNEFKGDEGIAAQKVLSDRISQARFPVISANVFHKSSGKEIVAPYKIFDIHGVKIGVFGLTAPRVSGYSQAEGLEIRDPIDVAKTIVAELRKKADFVIALTHIGYDYGPFAACDLTLAEEVPDIDLIVGGDSHTWLRQPTLIAPSDSCGSGLYICGTVVAHAGEWGISVGRLDLRIRRAGERRYRLMSYSSKIMDVDAGEAPAKDVEQAIDRYTKPMRKELARLKDGVDKSSIGAWLAQCLREAAGTQLAIVSSDAVEDGLDAGPVDELDLRRMCPWQHTGVLKTTLTVAQIRNVIAEKQPFVAGARIVDDCLHVGDDIAGDTASYTVALGDVYWLESSSIKDAKTQSTGMTIGGAAIKYLNTSNH